jgi:hypothetical protein
MMQPLGHMWSFTSGFRCCCRFACLPRPVVRLWPQLVSFSVMLPLVRASAGLPRGFIGQPAVLLVRNSDTPTMVTRLSSGMSRHVQLHPNVSNWWVVCPVASPMSTWLDMHMVQQHTPAAPCCCNQALRCVCTRVNGSRLHRLYLATAVRGHWCRAVVVLR